MEKEPYFLKMRAAYVPEMWCVSSQSMMSRSSDCEVYEAVIFSMVFLPMPATSLRRCGVCSMTVSVFLPNFCTMRLASDGPMPSTTPEARKRSMPSALDGASMRSPVTWNCWP